MILTLAVAVVSLAAGFGAGRIKNAAKLAAIKAEFVKIEAAAKAEEVAVVAKIKALFTKIGL